MDYRELFKIQGLPVFQNKMFPDRLSALTCPKGNMVLVQDMESGLIFNAAFDPGLLEYDIDYQNEQSYSSVFRRHLEDVKRIVERHFSGKSLIEVGCGKGHFLECLQQDGYEITGIDPAYEGDNPSIIKAPFEPSLGLSADAIILRHVLEHISNPFAFLSTIAAANGGNGQIYIEVPCFDWICGHHAWFDIFYEHVNYFRLGDFTALFGRLHEKGHLFGGQYLYVVADLATLRKPHIDKLINFEFPPDFLSGIKRMTELSIGKQNVIWGGASKGLVFALYMQQEGVEIDFVVDINPAKQGRFLAGTGLCVSAPDIAIKSLSPEDNIFVMNSNYLQEVVALTNNQFKYIQVDQHEF